MQAKFEVTMTQKIMYNFLMSHTYRSPAGVIGILFGLGAFVICGVTFGSTSTSMSILYMLFGVWFLFYTPVNLYLRAAKQIKANPAFKKPIGYLINGEGITTMQDDKQALIAWSDLVKVRETKLSILIYTGARYSFVLPRESMGEQYETVVTLMKEHIDPRFIKLKA